MTQRTTRAEFVGSAALWLALLAGPLAWIIQLVVSSELPEFMCAPGASEPAVFGVGVETVIVVINALLATATIAGAAVAWRCWRTARSGDHTTGARAPWMAVAGVMTNLLFLILIVPGFFPSLFLTECGRAL